MTVNGDRSHKKGSIDKKNILELTKIALNLYVLNAFT